MKKRPTIHTTMMTVANVMSIRSTCVRRRVGCVITDIHNQILSTGYNGVPKQWQHCIDKPCPGANYKSGLGLDECVAVHAESNALIECSNIDKAHHIYITTAPCMSCVKALINTPIIHIHYSHGYADTIASHKLWTQSDKRRTFDKRILNGTNS